MRNIKYLLVNDASSKSRACNSRHRFIPHIGHCIELDCGNRPELVDQLVKLRGHWPNANILLVLKRVSSYDGALFFVTLLEPTPHTFPLTQMSEP